MDKDTSYIPKFIVKCLLFLNRQLRQRRHKWSMATQDESLHQAATRPTPYERSSSKETYLIDFESMDDISTPLASEKGDMCHEGKAFNGSESGRQKKSLFEITRVENTDNRGENGGIDIEDVELDDTFPDMQDVSNPGVASDLTRSVSIPEDSSRDRNLVSSSNGSEISQAHTSSVGLTSRFKIVKVARAEPYTRGRWKCQEYMDTSTENKVTDRNLSETKTTSGNTTIQPVVHDSAVSFPAKQELKNVEQKLSPDHVENTNDNKNCFDSSPESVPETKGGVAASNQALIDNLETQREHLANFVQR